MFGRGSVAPCILFYALQYRTGNCLLFWVSLHITHFLFASFPATRFHCGSCTDMTLVLAIGANASTDRRKPLFRTKSRIPFPYKVIHPGARMAAMDISRILDVLLEPRWPTPGLGRSTRAASHTVLVAKLARLVVTPHLATNLHN